MRPTTAADHPQLDLASRLRRLASQYPRDRQRGSRHSCTANESAAGQNRYGCSLVISGRDS